MMSDIKSQAKSSRNTKLHALGGKGTVGKQLPMGAGSTWDGQVGVDSGQLADEQKIKTRKDGGRVGGSAVKPRLDRVARASGGKVGGKGKTNITIVMAPGQGGQPQAPQAVPVPRPVPVPIQAPPPGAGLPMGMGAPPMVPPAAGPPPGMARKRGGRVNKDNGGSTGAVVPNEPDGYTGDAEASYRSSLNKEGSTGKYAHDGESGNTPSSGPSPKTPTQRTSTPRNRASGGKVTVGKGLGMTAGGGGGEGRLQKAKMQKRTYP